MKEVVEPLKQKNLAIHDAYRRTFGKLLKKRGKKNNSLTESLGSFSF